jgi:hypothetical protein
MIITFLHNIYPILTSGYVTLYGIFTMPSLKEQSLF